MPRIHIHVQKDAHNSLTASPLHLSSTLTHSSFCLPTMQSTDLGRIASHYYVSYHSLATYNEHLRVTMGDIELLRLFALSDEFRFMVVRAVPSYYLVLSCLFTPILI